MRVRGLVVIRKTALETEAGFPKPAKVFTRFMKTVARCVASHITNKRSTALADLNSGTTFTVISEQKTVNRKIRINL